MSERAFVARFSPWRTLAGMVGCLGFVVLGLFLGGAFGGIDDPSPLIGYGCALVFGVFMLIGARRLRWRGPALRVDADGLSQWSGARKRFVPWSAVREIEEISVHRQRFLTVRLHGSAPWPIGPRFGDLSLSTHATDRRFGELREAIVCFAPARTLINLTSE